MQRLDGVKISRVSTVPFFVITQLKSQIEELSHQGASLDVMTSDDELAHKMMEQSSFSFTPVKICREISPWNDLCAVYSMWRIFRKNKVHIIHSTTPKAGLLSAIAGFLARVPIRLHTFTGQPWVVMTGLKRHLIKFFDWFIVKLNTQCFADSESQRQFLIDQNIGSKKSVKVIGKGSLAGINLNRFNPESISSENRYALKKKFNIDDDRFIFLFVGRITKDKGIYELLSACKQLYAQNYAFDLMIVGPFEHNIEHSIRKLAHEISNHIHFAGFSEQPEQFFALADVLCLPSYREGFGTVVIEAAAMGTTTIGTHIYGLTDAVIDGQTGLLVEPRKVEPLAQAMKVLMDDKVKCQRLSDAAQQRAIKYFDSKLHSQLLIRKYLALLKLKNIR